MGWELIVGLLLIIATGLFVFFRVYALNVGQRINVLLDDIGEPEARPVQQSVDVLLDDIDEPEVKPARFQLPELEHSMPAVLALGPEQLGRPTGRVRSEDLGPESPSWLRE